MNFSIKKPDTTKVKASLGTVATRKGGYSVTLSLAVVAIVAVVCLLLSLLPSKAKSFDISDSRIYSVSSITKDIVAGLEDNVEFIVVVENAANVDDRIVRLLEEYDAMSPNIYYRIVDCVQNPSILERFEVNTVNAVAESTGRTQSIAFSDIINVDEDMYFTQGLYVEKDFDGEGQFTSAIDYVTSEVDPHAYVLTGHEESVLSEGVAKSVSKLNVELVDLDLIVSGAVPADCEVLFINAPKVDLTLGELGAIYDYMLEGGTVMLLYDKVDAETMPNLYALCESFGFKVTEDYVGDLAQGYALTTVGGEQNPYFMMPNVTFAAGITNDVVSSNAMALIMNSRGVTTTDSAAGVTYREFLSTSEQACELVSAEDGSEEVVMGRYLLGVAATKANDNGTNADLILISSSILSDDVLKTYGSRLVNEKVFLGAFSWRIESLSNVSIAAKNLAVTYNIISGGALFGILYIAIIPIIVLAVGLIIWARRRRA